MDCVICDEIDGIDTVYCHESLCARERRDANADAVAEALGFCTSHAALIASCASDWPTLGSVLSAASARVVEFLTDRRRYDERLKDILFAAPTACPLCRFIEHELPRHVRDVVAAASASSMALQESAAFGPVCLPHFRALIATAPRSMLKCLAEREIESLVYISAAPGATLAQGEGSAADACVCEDPSLFRTLHAVAGSARLAELYGDGQKAVFPVKVPDLPIEKSLAHVAICPICAQVSHAFESWVGAVQLAARIRTEEWIVFPTCQTHIWSCARVCDEQAIHEIVAHASRLMIESLRQGVAEIDDADTAYEAASTSVWFKRKNAAYLLGQRRKTVLRAPRCPGCERLAVARDRAIATILELLRDDRHLRAFEAGHALCLKHFAHACLVAPRGKVRDALVRTQVAKLSELRRDLDRNLEPGEQTDTDSPIEEPRAMCRRAIYRFSALA